MTPTVASSRGKAHPPGPGAAESLRNVRAGAGELLGFFERTARRYGPVSSFTVLGRRQYLIDDADLIAQILVKDQHRYVRDSGAMLLRELLGPGLLTTEDPLHLQRRRLMQPAFHRLRVASYAATMVEESRRAATRWRDGEVVDIGDEMAALTLTIVGKALFGADVRDSVETVREVLDALLARGAPLLPLAAVVAPVIAAGRRVFPKRRSLLFPRERARLEAVIDPIVAKRRAEGAQGDDLLSLLLEARDEEGGALDDDALRDELLTLILAGHETTANALTWVWYLLSTHPHVEACMQAELDAVLGTRPPALDDVAQLPYTANVLDEAMRLYPPAGAFARRPVEAVELGGYAIPRMASIFLSPYVTQRNPRYFAEADAFVPERWNAPEWPKQAYFPFGAGSKMCIGEPFARLEGVLAIATLAQRVRFHATDAARVGIEARGALRPNRAIRLRVQVRPGA